MADGGGKESVEETEKQLADPEFIFDLGPKKLIKLTDFMNAAGTIKAQADLLEGDVLPGSARPRGRLRFAKGCTRSGPWMQINFDRPGPSICPVQP